MILGGDVGVNAGPKNSVSECLSICHWKLNSILADDYSKLFILKTYILLDTAKNQSQFGQNI